MDLYVIGHVVEAQRQVRAACDSLIGVAQDGLLPREIQLEARKLWEHLWEVQENDIPALADKVHEGLTT